MKDNLPTPDSEPSTDVDRRSRWPWLLAAGFALVILIGVFRSPHRNSSPAATTSTNVAKAGGGKTGSALGPARRQVRSPGSDQASTAEEIVAGKLSQFARSRREHVHALGRRHGVEVTADVERFFDAVESGDWDAIEVAFRKINGGDSSAGHSDTRPPGIDSLWPAIIDAYGVAEQVHEWPAQKLLDYGNAVLGSLRPGMVYVGGTDNGRWIPELLNDTSDGEHHVIITQNALADSTYDEAAPLGPLMKLRPQGGQNSLNVERASESVGYWRDTTRQILSDPEASGSPTALKSYSHDAAAAANLLAAHNYTTEAEQAYRLSSQLWPGNPEPVFSLAKLLASSGREDEARQMLGDFGQKYPDQQKALEQLRATFRFVGPAQTPQP